MPVTPYDRLFCRQMVDLRPRLADLESLTLVIGNDRAILVSALHDKAGISLSYQRYATNLRWYLEIHHFDLVFRQHPDRIAFRQPRTPRMEDEHVTPAVA